jgi:HD-GYP domain-containing protein (c-di-GMP phosphodiesterase class II)
MPVDKALSIMTEMLGTAIDPRCFAALNRALRRVDPALAA